MLNLLYEDLHEDDSTDGERPEAMGSKMMTAKRTMAGMLAALMLFAQPVSAEQALADAGFKEKALSASSVEVSAAYQANKPKSLKASRAFVNAYDESAVRLLKEAVKTSRSGNIMLSPDSILTAMSIVMNGAKGSTLSEMKKAFGGIGAAKYSRYLSTLNRRIAKSKRATYVNANSIWYHKGKVTMKDSFLKKSVSDHGAEIYAAPFSTETVRDINNWVFNHTKGKIDKIINNLHGLSRVVIVNTVYFKGDWPEPYAYTKKRTFTKANGKTQKVSMLEGVEHEYLEAGGGTGFVKPYAGGETAFLALLPPKGMSVEAYVAGLTGKGLADAYRKRIKQDVIVQTRIPEFEFRYQTSLKKALRRMGIKKAFSSSANFSGMTKESVAIDDVLHKTFIRLDKKGTEAAAVTAVLMKASSVMPRPQMIRQVFLDRPFVCGIIDTKTGAPLFLGVVRGI